MPDKDTINAILVLAILEDIPTTLDSAMEAISDFPEDDVRRAIAALGLDADDFIVPSGA